MLKPACTYGWERLPPIRHTRAAEPWATHIGRPRARRCSYPAGDLNIFPPLCSEVLWLVDIPSLASVEWIFCGLQHKSSIPGHTAAKHIQTQAMRSFGFVHQFRAITDIRARSYRVCSLINVNANAVVHTSAPIHGSYITKGSGIANRCEITAG